MHIAGTGNTQVVLLGFRQSQFPGAPKLSGPANELEGLIRAKLPDSVRGHLIDVIIDPVDADGLAANWTAQPVWSHEVSNNDKGEFIRAMFEVLRDYDLLTDD